MNTHARPQADAPLSHEARLDKLAETAVRVGLGLQKGQEIVMTAPVEAIPLVRRITEHAYRAGASLVTTLIGDDVATLMRYRHAPDESFDKASGWLFEGMAKAFQNGAARLAVVGDDPNLLSGQDPDKVARANRARSIAYQPALELIAGFATNWSILSCSTPAWARTVFPGEEESVAVAKLWDAIFRSSRVDGADPIADWAEHNRNLAARTALLNGKRYAALRFSGPGTDLEVGLADGHEWNGGATTAQNGIVCNANIPTEEVFTTPHKDRVSGTVRSTKPLSYQGTLIDDIEVRFEGGRIVDARASKGENVLRQVLDIDDGARRLGEVALVPFTSPISDSGLLFYNTLYDENAASHIALGQSYSKCLVGGTKLSKAEIAARGGNASLIHIDWMIGSNRIDVDGVTGSGEREPVMRAGEWVS